MVINKTKNTQLGDNIHIVISFWKKLRGLMGKTLRQGEGLIIDEGKNSYFLCIWMFGMKIPIDLIFVSDNYTVVDIYENIKPLTLNPRTWKTYHPRRPARYALELPVGAVSDSKTEIGDVLEFIQNNNGVETWQRKNSIPQKK